MTTKDTVSAHEQAIERATDGIEFGRWIDGAVSPATSGKTFDAVDPAVKEPIAAVPRCEKPDVDEAVAAAERAGEKWRTLTASERADRLQEWVDVLYDHLEELALLESLEVGKPIEHAKGDVETGLEFLEYYARAAVGIEGEQLSLGEDSHAYVRREPYGVAGQILPWNYPMLLFGWKTGAALPMGNTVACKPAEQAGLSIVRAAQLSEGILPDGVLNVVPGLGEEAGAPLTGHGGVDKLSFTGSVPTGQAVMEAAADGVTPVTLELGGKNPFIVFPDADLESAAATAASGGFYNVGQSCDSATRLILHESIKDEFLELYLEEVETHSPGDPLEEDTAMGPLCFEGQYEKVERYVELGQEEGAELIAGGDRPSDPDGEGWFYEPTVFDDVTAEMRIAQEEVFGPVQFVMTFEGYEEAIELANDVDYGLTSGVMTGDPSTAHSAAADLEAGSVWINQYFGTVPGTPFGGFNDSGIGRECGKEALLEYTQSKAVHMALDTPEY
jgi:aldehyde dehydrogenase (NAD+)